jgi:hypothetical protein
LTLKEDHRLRVLRTTFGPKRDEMIGGWRKLHNEELHNLYSSPSIIRIIKSRRMRSAGHVTRMREKRNVYRILVVKPGIVESSNVRRRSCGNCGNNYTAYTYTQTGSLPGSRT